MASLIQVKTYTWEGTSPHTFQLNSPTTAGNTLILCYGGDGATSNPSVSALKLGGSADNWASVVAESSGENASIWYDPNCAGGQTSIEVDLTGGVSQPNSNVTVMEWSGLVNPTSADQTGVGGSFSASTPWSVSTGGATSQAAELIIGTAFVFHNGSAPTVNSPGSPWTEIAGADSSGDMTQVTGWQIVAATGTYTYNGTATSSGDYAACIATFKLASGVTLPTGNITLGGNGLTPSTASVSVYIVSTSLPAVAPGQPYYGQLVAAGGTMPYTWSIIAGTLPQGLVMSNGGLITGTPTATGVYRVTFQVTDASSGTAQIMLAIYIGPQITTPAFPQPGGQTWSRRFRRRQEVPLGLPYSPPVISPAAPPTLPEAVPSRWGNAVAPLVNPEPGNGYEIRVLSSQSGYGQVAAWIPRYTSLQFSKVLKDKGAGTLVAAMDDPFWQQASIALPNVAAPFTAGSFEAVAPPAARVYSIPVTANVPSSAAVTVAVGNSGTNEVISVTDTQGNLYFPLPLSPLTANPLMQTGSGPSATPSVVGWNVNAGLFSATTAPAGALFPCTGLLSPTTTAPFGCTLTAQQVFAAAVNTPYWVTALVYSSVAQQAEIGFNWLNSNVAVSTTTVTVTLAQGWNVLSQIITSPASAINQGTPVLALQSSPALVTNFWADTVPAGFWVWQSLWAGGLIAGTDSISITFANSVQQSTVALALATQYAVQTGGLDICQGASGTSTAPSAGTAIPSFQTEQALLVVLSPAAPSISPPAGSWQLAGQITASTALTLTAYSIPASYVASVGGAATLSSSGAWQAALLSLVGEAQAVATAVFDQEHVWQVLYNGEPVFEFLGETVTRQTVDQSEQYAMTITGPGTIATLGWAMAAPPGFPNIVQKTDAIQDGFAEINSSGQLQVDVNLWNKINLPSQVLLNPSGTLQINATTQGTYVGASAYDLTSSLFSAQVVPVGQAQANLSTTSAAPVVDGSVLSQMYFQSNANPANYALMGVSPAGLYCQFGDAVLGAQTFNAGPYDPTNQLYWQISHEWVGTPITQGLQRIRFWTSPDGQTWTPIFEVTNASWVPNNGTVFFAARIDLVGPYFMAVTAVNSNVITPSSAGNTYFGEPIMGIWNSVLQAAQARGTIPWVTTRANIVTDSFGNPWTDSVSVQIQNGTDLYSLLQTHAGIVNADWIMEPGFQLVIGLPVEVPVPSGGAGNPVSLGVDRSAQVVIHPAGALSSLQEVRDRSAIQNVVGAVNSDGTTISASNLASALTWNQREGWVQTAVQVDPASIQIAAQASILQTKDQVFSSTIQINPAWPGAQPWVSFDVGDWVGVESYEEPGLIWQVMWYGDGVTANPSIVWTTLVPVQGSQWYNAAALVACPQGWVPGSPGWLTGNGVEVQINWLNAAKVSVGTSTSTPLPVPAGATSGVPVALFAQSPATAVWAQVLLIAVGTPPYTTHFLAAAGSQPSNALTSGGYQ